MSSDGHVQLILSRDFQKNLREGDEAIHSYESPARQQYNFKIFQYKKVSEIVTLQKINFGLDIESAEVFETSRQYHKYAFSQKKCDFYIFGDTFEVNFVII